jgi:hypothetical protein
VHDELAILVFGRERKVLLRRRIDTIDSTWGMCVCERESVRARARARACKYVCTYVCLYVCIFIYLGHCNLPRSEGVGRRLCVGECGGVRVVWSEANGHFFICRDPIRS